jgi:hypothetical protein
MQETWNIWRSVLIRFRDEEVQVASPFSGGGSYETTLGSAFRL